jgi:hypothetical protein
MVEPRSIEEMPDEVFHRFVANEALWAALEAGSRGIVELMAERWLRLAHMTALLGLWLQLVLLCS